MDLKNKPYYLFLLALLSGFIFWLGWPVKPLPFLLFFAFIPLLITEEYLAASLLRKRGLKFFGYSYIALLTWNVLTTYWIYNATAGGGIFAMAANAFLMCIPLLLFHHTKRLTSPALGQAALIVYWLTFEFIHLNWKLTWPWLTLGNAFSSTPSLVQWYEYTGTLGGSLWILLMNVFLFRIYKHGKDIPMRKKNIIAAAIFAFIPVIISLIIYYRYEDQGKDLEVVVVQPNIDPYNEKFEGGENFIPYGKQMDRMITLSQKAAGAETRYIVWPETALPLGYPVEALAHDSVVKVLQQFLKKYPQLSLVTGLDTYKFYQTKATPTARPSSQGFYFDAFNSAMQINENMEISVYHKSKLVPGVEYMPPAIASLTIALGEAAGGLGWQETRTVFFNREGTGIAPVICYESIFGEFVTEYIRKGANVIFIITNDGWWGNTQGHKQHMQYATLRAIETRKSIARSANTGISGFINQRGDIVMRSEYWEQNVLRMKIKQNAIKTFYTLQGDYIGWLASLAAAAAFVLALAMGIRKK